MRANLTESRRSDLTDSEFYDKHIGPSLEALARLCAKRGISFLSVVDIRCSTHANAHDAAESDVPLGIIKHDGFTAQVSTSLQDNARFSVALLVATGLADFTAIRLSNEPPNGIDLDRTDFVKA